MKVIEIRNKYLNFFQKNGHKIISGARLVPSNDYSVLFTTAGMQPLMQYFSGKTHPSGSRVVDFQKCLRTNDIDEVGDNRHLTFFEMLGNWSFGDYFKQESIRFSFEFLTKELGIDKEKISVTCFAGDETSPKDEEAALIWEECGIPKERIYFLGKEDNWWEIAGCTGPCGPDTEIFLDTGKDKCCQSCNPSCDCGKYVEIWNNVFTQYNKKEDTSYELLSQTNVDTGMGLERMAFLLQGKKDVFEIELFVPIIQKIESMANNINVASVRIIADHMRAAVMLVCDGVTPLNIGQGYILRRLIRRAIRHLRKININVEDISQITNVVIDTLKEMYPELEESREKIVLEINKEKNRFMNTLLKGEKEFNKIVLELKDKNIKIIDGQKLFRLYDTFGFPPELTAEEAEENGLKVDIDGYNKCFETHQEISRANIATFKGGLADHSIKTTKYHTAVHLILEAMQRLLGENVTQKGSNITTERIRFDFSYPQKVTREQLDLIENMVNEQIDKKLNVICEEMPIQEARNSGAKGIFDNKYLDIVKVYTIGDFSKEICGGPHINNTSQLQHIKIIKEEAVSSGVRRIKATFVS
ncbi:MAG: alanine--tRNA ligase [Clostridia bacterium]